MAQVKKRKVKRNVEQGRIYIKATFNNTIMTITDAQGNAIGWSSTGVHGFKGSRKSTPFAARVAADDALKKAVESGMKSVDVFVKGPGSGRESALRQFQLLKICVSHQSTILHRFLITGAGHQSKGESD